MPTDNDIVSSALKEHFLEYLRKELKPKFTICSNSNYHTMTISNGQFGLNLYNDDNMEVYIHFYPTIIRVVFNSQYIDHQRRITEHDIEYNPYSEESLNDAGKEITDYIWECVRKCGE